MESHTYFYGQIPIEFSLDENLKKEILHKFPIPNFPDKPSGFDLQQREKGEPITLDVLVSEYSHHLTRQQKQFIRLTLNHYSGVINAVIWDNNGEVERFTPLLEQYTAFSIGGLVHEYNKQKSITINKLDPITENIQAENYLPATQSSVKDLSLELFAYLYELNEPYQTIALQTMEKFWQDFSESPAAKSYHHNYLGGLLKHTVGLMRFARFILLQEENHFQAVMKLIHTVEKVYKKELWDKLQDKTEQRPVWQDTIEHLYHMFDLMIQVKDEVPNRDLVMLSILFHDLGKILEYDYAGRSSEAFSFLFPTGEFDFSSRQARGISFDALGQMIGHIPYGFLLFSKMIEEINVSLPLEDIHAISHCILSHHGLPEWGSAVRQPLIIEAFIVHLVDFLDSRYENVVEIK